MQTSDINKSAHCTGASKFNLYMRSHVFSNICVFLQENLICPTHWVGEPDNNAPPSILVRNRKGGVAQPIVEAGASRACNVSNCWKDRNWQQCPRKNREEIRKQLVCSFRLQGGFGKLHPTNVQSHVLVSLLVQTPIVSTPTRNIVPVKFILMQ